MKRVGLVIFAVAVVALMAPNAAAQCGCCGGHHGVAAGRGPQLGQGPRAAAPMYDANTVTTLAGKVISVEVEAAGSGRIGGTHIMLQAGEKQTEVHVGPAWFLEEQGFAAVKGDMLTVTGSLVTSGDTTYLIAREVKKGDTVTELRNAEGIPKWSRGRRR